MMAHWTIHKFNDPTNQIGVLGQKGVPLEQLLRDFAGDFTGKIEFEKNLLLNEGINALWQLVCLSGGCAVYHFDAANAYIGVGDSSTAAAASQTALQAAGNKLYLAMDSTYPTYGTSQKATWRSTFSSAQANFAWEEITVASGNSDSSVNLNRKVSAMGTKTSGSTWIASLDITLA